MPDSRHCTRCPATLTGRQSKYCAECAVEARRERQQRYFREIQASPKRDARVEAKRQYRKDNKDKVLAYRKTRVHHERARHANRRAEELGTPGRLTAQEIGAAWDAVGGRCVCGAPAKDMDHARPMSKGGPNIASNLQFLCSTCHGRKTGIDGGGLPLASLPSRRAEMHMRDIFREAARRRGYCAVCHARPLVLHAHHCIEASVLKRELRAVVGDLRLVAILNDPRNALGLCEVCHMGHHGPSLRSRITRQHIPEAAWEFARELDLLTSTEKFTVRLESYPEIAEAA